MATLLTSSTRAAAWDPGEPIRIGLYSEVPSFGSSVSLDRDTLVVGAPEAQKAYIFERRKGIWDFRAAKELTMSEDVAKAFGWAVDTCSQYTIVSAVKARSAFIYSRDDGKKPWKQVTKLDKNTDEDQFGTAVGISSSFAVVTAAKASKIFVYGRKDGKWGTSPVAAFAGISYQLKEDDGFGYSVGISDRHLIVGAPNAGVAFIFAASPEGDKWPLDPVADIRNYSHEHGFGFGVAISSDDAIVGARSAAKAFIFQRKQTKWDVVAIELDKYTASSGFGWSVAISTSSGMAVVSAFASRKAFVFKCVDGKWNPEAFKVLDSATHEEGFGASLAIGGQSVAVTAQGLLYLYYDPQGDIERHVVKKNADVSSSESDMSTVVLLCTAAAALIFCIQRSPFCMMKIRGIAKKDDPAEIQKEQQMANMADHGRGLSSGFPADEDVVLD